MAAPRSRRARGPERTDYWTLSELRYYIRRFLRGREVAARAAGIAPQQYLLLLQVKGMEGRRAATVGAIAERLQLQHHTIVELVDRLEERGLVARRRGGEDRRAVLVEVTPAGEAIVRRLAQIALIEIRTEGPALIAALRRLIASREPKAKRPSRTRALRPHTRGTD